MTSRGFSMPKECSVTIDGVTCGRTIPRDHLMCAAHWRRVPKDVQRDVWRTYRAWHKDMTDERWTDYLAARAAAHATLRSTP